MQRRLFIRHPEDWTHCFGESHLLKDHADVQVVKNGIVLPLQPIPESELPYPVLDLVGRGGVCTDDFKFVAGHQRSLERVPTNLDCLGAYRVNESDIEVRHESVVFGGFLYRHLGHTIADTFTRLWYPATHPGCGKVVFLTFPLDTTSDFDPVSLISLMGISQGDIEILDKPTRFDEVIVPDEAFVSFSGYMPEFAIPFQAIADRVADGPTPEKVYLSRTSFQQTQENARVIINESFFERFFSKRGFEIVYPEQLTIQEQVRIIRGADEIVTTAGTLTHMLVFAKPCVKATILLREVPMFIQANIDEACGIAPYYVDASSNPLPVDHAHGPYLMVPNRFFRQYLDATGIEHDDGELDIEDEKQSLILEFLLEWAKTYRQPGATSHHVSSETMFDVIRRMNDALYDDTFDEDAYREAGRLSDADAMCEAALREIVDLHNSTSWKLTKPLRALKDLVTDIRKPPESTERTGNEPA